MPFVAPIVGAVVGAIGSIGTAIGGIASFLGGSSILAGIARLGLGIAAKYALNAFFGPDKTERPAQAVQLETQYGENLVRTVVLGTVGHAGHHVYRNAYGSGNHIVQDVYVLSHFRIDGVARIRFNGEWKTLGGIEDAEKGFRIQGIDAEIWIKVYTGRMDQVADQALIDHANPAGRWTVNHRGAGVAYAIVTSVLDREHLPNPWEAFFELRGAPLYDWRKDSTVGGTGTHRWDDQDTWEFDENHNPVLMMYALERGIFNGTEKMVGKGISPSKLPLSRWTIAANIAEEAATGGTRYRASCIATSGPGRTHENNMAPLREACAATWVELVDGEYPIVGAEQAVVATFTDDDLVVGQSYRYSAKRTRSELVNTVAGSFIDPGNFYQSVPFATRIDAAALAEDGERFAASIPYSAVTVPECVDRLADIAIRASRYQASAEIWLRPKFLTLKPGDWVTWISARNGTKTYQVLSKQLGPFGSDNCRNVHVSLQEVGIGIFDPTAYVTRPPAGAIQGSPDFLTEVQDFIVAGVPVDVDGKSVPALRATWRAIDDPTVTAVEVQWWPTDQPTAVITTAVPADQSVLVTLDVVADTEYQVRTRLVTRPYRVTAWSDPATATTPAGGYGIFPVDLDDFSDEVKELQEFTGSQARDVIDQVLRMSTAVAKMTLSGLDRAQQIRREVSVVRDDITSEYEELITTSITEVNGQITVLAAQYEALKVQVDNDLAQSISAVQVQIDDLGDDVAANIDAINLIDAKVDDVGASVTLRTTVEASPGGGWIRRGLRVVVDENGTLSEVADYIDVNGALSRRVFIANETYFVDPADQTNMVTAIAFVDGVGYIPDLRVGRLRSFNGKLDIQGLGTNASIEVFS